MRLIKEPLLQFLFFGGILFWIYTKTIKKDDLNIDKSDLINFMQYQANSFNQEVFNRKYEALSPAEKQNLLQQFIEEEVLVKEAQKLNLQQNDNVIKHRLIQKMKYILKEEAQEEPSKTALETYYKQNLAKYSKDENCTFSHVFFSFENHPPTEALKLTKEFINKSKKQKLNPEQALNFSERYPYFHHYTQRNFSFITSNFGNEFTTELAKLKPDNTIWQGPLKSNLGYHAVLLRAKTLTSTRPFNEVLSLVKQDYLSDNGTKYLANKIKNLANGYTITSHL